MPKARTKTPEHPRIRRKNDRPRVSSATASGTQLGLATVEATLERLAGETVRALAQIGEEGSGPRALSRAIGVDVALAQRLLAAMRSGGTVSQRLAQWPGVTGVRTAAEKLSVAAGRQSLAGPLLLAVDGYAKLVRDGGGTQARLIRTVRAIEASDGEPARLNTADQLASRRALTRGAAQTLGYGVQLCTFVSFLRPIPDRPELIEGCSAWGLIGIESHGSRVCITSQNTQPRAVAGSLADEVRWRPLGDPIDGRDGALTEFCSRPLPISASDDGDGFIRQMIEPDAASSRGPVDVVLARHWSPDSNPQYNAHNRAWSQIVRMRHAARRLVFDVYIHKSMLDRTPPVVSAYFWHPALNNDPRRQWHDRLPGSPRIEILPLPPHEPSSDAWAKQPALTARLTQLAGWPREDFVGFRCDERFPLWSAAYYMTFDLAPPG